MATTSNFKQSAHQILVDLVNASNAATGLALAPGQISFGAVAPKVGGAAEDTVVTISSEIGSGYRGTVDVEYKRVPMSFMENLAPTLVIETEAANTHELIDYLNDVFGINLQAGDLVSTAIPALMPDENTDVVFAAEAASKIFVGETTIPLTKTLITLSTVILVTELDGLYAPEQLPE